MSARDRISPPLKWHGGKWYLAPKIVALMPAHVHYVEPFAGGLSVLLAKDPAGVSEVVNDIRSPQASEAALKPVCAGTGRTTARRLSTPLGSETRSRLDQGKNQDGTKEESRPCCYDLPLWVLGLVCLLVLAVPVTLVLVVVIAANRPGRRPRFQDADDEDLRRRRRR
jgi:D12 class N6 adenine-specific DNA methyltransferase